MPVKLRTKEYKNHNQHIMPPKIDKQTHPAYTKISRFISDDVPREMLPALEKEREIILEKAAILYEAAIKLPRAFSVMDEQSNAVYSDVVKKGGKDHLDKEGEDALLYKYIDLVEYIRCEFDNVYDDKDFAASIAIFASRAMNIVADAAKQMLTNQPKEKKLQPKKSVSINEEANERVIIEHQIKGEWTRRVKSKNLPGKLITNKPNKTKLEEDNTTEENPAKRTKLSSQTNSEEQKNTQEATDQTTTSPSSSIPKRSSSPIETQKLQNEQQQITGKFPV